MLDEADRQHLTNILFHVKAMVENGEVEPEWHHKALVGAAYEYAKEDEISNAIELLDQVPATYYTEVIHGHMAADENYAAQVLALSTCLVKRNMVHLGFDDNEQKVVAKA